MPNKKDLAVHDNRWFKNHPPEQFVFTPPLKVPKSYRVKPNTTEAQKNPKPGRVNVLGKLSESKGYKMLSRGMKGYAK